MLKGFVLSVIVASGFCLLDAACAQAPGKVERENSVNFARFLPSKIMTITGDENLADCSGDFAGNHLQIWNADDASSINEVDFSTRLEEVQMNHQGNKLATWNTDGCDHPVDGCVRLMDISTDGGRLSGSLEGIFGGPKTLVSSVVFSPDDKLLVAGYDHSRNSSEDPNARKSIRIFETATFSEIAYFNADSWVSNLQFSPDGKLLAAISHGLKDSHLVLWDFTNRRKKLSVLLESNTDYKFTSDSASVVFSDSGSSGPIYLNLSQSKPTFQPYDIDKARDLFEPGFTATTTNPDTEITLHHRKRDVTITLRRSPRTGPPPLGNRPEGGFLTRSSDGEMALLDSTLIDFQKREVRNLPMEKISRPWHLVKP